MVRGWAPAVEAELIAQAGAPRATRLALTYIGAFPDSYRSRSAPEEGAADILRLCGLADDARSRRPHLALPTRRAAPAAPEDVPQQRAHPAVRGGAGAREFRLPRSRGTPDRARRRHRLYPRLPRRGRARRRISSRSSTASARSSGRSRNVLCGAAEDDEFNQLVLYAGLDTQAVVWLRAWFRYLRQTGSSFGLVTVVDALRRAPNATRALIGLFVAAHDPVGQRTAKRKSPTIASSSTARWRRSARSTTTGSCGACALWSLAISADQCFRARRRRKRSRSRSIPREVPGLPAPVPWREIWVYSPRVEGIHLRGGPVARGGIRWSDRRDDFRTEILGLMKAQLVKNAVIVPTGAKGGFYPKQLPPMSNRDAWLAEGTESYRIFIRSLLSITDNLVNDKVVHPPSVVIHDGDDPYFVVAADKGTATFSDIANEIALDRNFWLGDAFASGGSNGYDHKAMGITARGAWISVQRHFLEMGVDVQSDEVTVAGCGDMSGDVFGNGMLLSKSLKADRRLRPPAHLHRSQSRSGDELGRAQAAVRAAALELGRLQREADLARAAAFSRAPRSRSRSAPKRARRSGSTRRRSIRRASSTRSSRRPVDLLWFGGIGTYIKSSTQSQADVGDPSNDALRAERERASREGHRRRRQSRDHPGRPHRVRRARRAHQHRLHRQ